MSTNFLALQCSQCSTMQVKQQKKSSNKWVCVVCNSKQSVLKVHARGPVARDLRKFVQEFNMSRMEIDNNQFDGSDSFPPVSNGSRDATSADEDSHKRKKRVDWSEYMDPVEETRDDDKTAENGYEVEIITEMPPKKPKITCPKYQPKIYENKSFRKNITNRKRDYEDITSKGYLSTGTDEKKDEKKNVVTNGRSRWSQYLDTGDEEKGFNGDELNYNCTDLDVTEKPANELLVEDEVHPDFW